MGVQAHEPMAWQRPSNSKRFHVFTLSDGRSLCGKWMFLAKVTPDDTGELARLGGDECAACRRKLLPKLTTQKAGGQ